MTRLHRLLLGAGLALLIGCGSTGTHNSLDAGGGDGGDGPPPGLCPMRTVPCTDQSIQQLNLFKTVSSRAIDNQADGAGFASHVDATAGGIDPTEAFVYAKFTGTGLERVNLSDEAALASREWDIAFRRFIIRLNSGVSGPSCVTGAQAPGASYDALTAAPSGLTLQSEAYFDSSCTFVPDSSGLNSPATVLESFWSYPLGCVKMTGNVFVLGLADGRKVKLVVNDYYDPAVQMMCDSTGTLPMSATGSGNIRMRWALLGS